MWRRGRNDLDIGGLKERVYSTHTLNTVGRTRVKSRLFTTSRYARAKDLFIYLFALFMFDN